ncbi:hypothetical protein ABB02_00825 [Clostridiaceae bacterium JG1575]|nr:hypothetical protein ABB02_00825 [Clostridiaceae bacterium JG1575]
MSYNGIIIFGEMGSGKDTLADFIIEEDRRVKKYGLGDIIRLIKKVTLVDPQWFGDERSFMQRVADKLREIDMDILNHFALAKMLEENLKDFQLTKDHYREDLDALFQRVRDEGNTVPMIVGGRTWMDYEYWKNRGFLTVGLTASPENRRIRLILRDGEQIAQKSDFTHNTEMDVRDIIEKCELIVSNDGDLKELKSNMHQVTERF